MRVQTWHIHALDVSRAFAKPTTLGQRMAMLLKGWRPFNEYWWSKASKKCKAKLKL